MVSTNHSEVESELSRLCSIELGSIKLLSVHARLACLEVTEGALKGSTA